MTGLPLKGTRVIEVAGKGPVPFCAMMLADLGAEIIRIDRPGGTDNTIPPSPVLERGRRSIELDLKSTEGRDVIRRLIESSSVLVEGYRPGVAERLGFGPDIAHDLNDSLVYCRMTGWGQHGPLAQSAGHDINYIALTGLLHAVGNERPVPPLNLVGDYAGGAALAAFGILASLLNVSHGERRQLVDSAMADGVAYLLSLQYGLLAGGAWTLRRASNTLDGGSPLYTTYECADGKHIAIGALEPKFSSILFEGLGIGDPGHLSPADHEKAASVRSQLAARFAQRSRADWIAHFEGQDACVTPVLDLQEATEHPHARGRSMFRTRDGVVEPCPSPRFSFPAAETSPAPTFGQHSESILRELGYEDDQVERILNSGAIHRCPITTDEP